jgi:hypothetical protein
MPQTIIDKQLIKSVGQILSMIPKNNSYTGRALPQFPKTSADLYPLIVGRRLESQQWLPGRLSLGG